MKNMVVNIDQLVIDVVGFKHYDSAALTSSVEQELRHLLVAEDISLSQTNYQMGELRSVTWERTMDMDDQQIAKVVAVALYQALRQMK